MTKDTLSGKESLSTTVTDYTKHTSDYDAPRLISELSELGLYAKNPRRVALATLNRMKKLEEIGYKFDDALASVHLLILETMGSEIFPFEITHWETSTVRAVERIAKVRANLKGTVGYGTGARNFSVSSEGVGPINAVDLALRKALSAQFPETKNVKLVSYSLNIVDSESGSAAPARARTQFLDYNSLLDSVSNHHTWATVSVSDDVVDASIRALVDGYRYKLIFLNKKERFAIPDWRAAIS